MNVKLLTLALVLGLAAALPTNNLKKLRPRKNVPSNDKLEIYKGKKTDIKKHNYVVSLLYNGDLMCAGVILGDQYVLTLGTCVTGNDRSKYLVVTGSDNAFDGLKYSVKKITIHPDFDEAWSHDFAVLKIKGTFKWGNKVGNVTLPSSNPKSGTNLVVVGYGADSYLEDSEGFPLRKGVMKYVNATTCKPYYQTDFDSTMACAYNKGKVTTCEGDLGDPFTVGNVLYALQLNFDDQFDHCTSTARPVIIGNVYSVLDWIKKNIAS